MLGSTKIFVPHRRIAPARPVIHGHCSVAAEAPTGIRDGAAGHQPLHRDLREHGTVTRRVVRCGAGGGWLGQQQLDRNAPPLRDQFQGFRWLEVKHQASWMG